MQLCNRRQDKDEKSFTMAKYWFGIVCECDDEGTFARKLRVFLASEAMLEDLSNSYLKLDDIPRGSPSRASSARARAGAAARCLRGRRESG